MSLITSVSIGSTDSFTADTSGSPKDTTGATELFAWIADYQQETASTPQDSKSNTWTLLRTDTTASLVRLALFYAENPTVGAGHTFQTVNNAGGAAVYPALGVLAFSGTPSSSTDDGSSNSQATASGVTLATGTCSPTTATNLLVSGLTNSASPGSTPTLDSGFTVHEFVDYALGQHFPLTIASLSQSTAIAQDPTWSWTTLGIAIANIAAFKLSPPPVGRFVLLT